MLEELCKRIQHCCATLRRSRNKKMWELLAKTFDRFQTLRNNMQQHPTTCYTNTHASSENQVQSVGSEEKAGRKFSSTARTWKLSLRPFSWLDWLPLGLRGWFTRSSRVWMKTWASCRKSLKNRLGRRTLNSRSLWAPVNSYFGKFYWNSDTFNLTSHSGFTYRLVKTGLSTLPDNPGDSRF